MKRQKWLYVIFAVILCSCISMGVNFNYPSEVSSMCYGAKNDAKAAIQSVGKSLKEKKSLKLVIVPGEKLFSGYWGFWSTEWNQYVLGLCYSGDTLTIKVASDPRNGTINYDVVKHEHGHYWLMSNFNDYSHNPIYAKLFFNWRDATRSIMTNEEGVVIVVDFPPIEE